MSKRILMLSTAAAALLSSAALADTTIDSTSGNKTTSYTTGALLTDGTGEKNAGNITITSGYSVAVSGIAEGAVTINTNNWLLQQGTLSNKDKDGASGIHVDMSANPDYTGTSITLTSGSAAATGIYLDSSSSTTVSGSGSNKVGIFFDTASCTAMCTFKGAVTLASNSLLSVTGDNSAAIRIGSSTSSTTTYGVLEGNLLMKGTVTAAASTSSATATGVFGLASYGQIKGDLTLDYGASLSSVGHGAVGILLGGLGVTGAVNINGTLQTAIINENTNNYNQYSKVNTSTNPEAGSALEIGGSIGGGISIGGASTTATASYSGSIVTSGESPAIAISPSFSAMTQTTPLTIGVFADSANPGFSFYNRGTVSASYTNYNKPTIAMQLAGTSTTLATTLTGGFYNSGSLQAAAQTSNDVSTSSGVYAYGLVVGSYVNFLPNTVAKNDAGPNDPGDDAALVVSGATSGGGTISASVSGTRGGTARAILIAATANVPSLINTGTISASVTTTTASLLGGESTADPLAAIAIEDDSGSLTSIINSGTISATAGYSNGSSSTLSALDNNSQVAIAIRINGNDSGTTIDNYASSTKSALITGDIIFGSGKNQVLDLVGKGSLYSIVSGNVTFGSTTDSNSVDRLHLGMNSLLSGKVVTLAAFKGVQVDIDAGGTLNLLNTTTALSATTVNVSKNGTLILGVNRQLTASGMITAEAVNIVDGTSATTNYLSVNYASYLPKATNVDAQGRPTYQFVLMTAGRGLMTIDQGIIDKFNNSQDVSGNSTRPYLLKAATMCNTGNGNCTRPTTLSVNQDALLIDVVAKTPTELGLNAKSVAVTPLTTNAGTATTLFAQANLALAVDDELGSAFLNGITNASQAAKAYNDMAPGVTGGTRAIAISITDSATGPVAARQRALRMYGKTGGDFTIWGQEFVQMIKDPGTGDVDVNTGFKTNPGFKDHGFGLSLGIDGGSPKYGWYGGALTFYAGDVNELSRDAHQNQQWYLLSLYSTWRGKGLFLDTKLDAGYGHIDGKRSLALLRPTSVSTYWPNSNAYYVREADNTHAGELVSGSIATGAMFTYGAATFMPQVNLDGMYLREERYTEHNPSTTTVGDGFDLTVGQYYAKSLRAFVGFDTRYDLKLWDVFLQPELRAGYRYDFVSDPVKLKAAFAYSNVSTNSVTAGDTFEITGPDPSQGNFVLGASLATTTDTWTLSANFDIVKGSNDSFQQVATVHILGRI